MNPPPKVPGCSVAGCNTGGLGLETSAPIAAFEVGCPGEGAALEHHSRRD